MATPRSSVTAELTSAQVLGWRMERQLLDPIGNLDVRETVRALAGIQAQVQSSAELAIALRRPPGPAGDTAAAIADGTIMRTWAMRGTLHLLDPVQGGALLALLATTRRWESAAWQGTYGVGPAELEELIGIVREALDGRILTREQVIEAALEGTGSRDLEEHMRSGWGGILKPLAWLGHLCNGPAEGGRVTFTRPDTWLREWRGLPPVPDAARIAIPAYLRAHGPATVATFNAWLARGACRTAEVRSWFEHVSDLTTTVTVDGEPRLALAADVESLVAAPPARGVRLTAGFDQYVLGPGTSDTALVAAHRRAAVSRTAGWISPLLLDAGRVAGVWSREGDQLVVTRFAESRRIGASVLAAEARRVAAALGRTLTLVVVTG
ncbi:MAG: crosslink repair DNA glycosylase YcaQ family protein [Solirubrobacteraceae bacterium]